MTGDIDPSRLRLTEEGRKLLDTGIRDCPYCKKQPQIYVQKATGRYCIKCNNLVERSWTRCVEMDTCGRPMEKAVEKWNRKVDRVHERQERQERKKMKEDKYGWVRVK